jgi:hypothetical protein
MPSINGAIETSEVRELPGTDLSPLATPIFMNTFSVVKSL